MRRVNLIPSYKLSSLGPGLASSSLVQASQPSQTNQELVKRSVNSRRLGRR